MLNTDVKKQINTARDILVGKIPDPKGQIDQITNALIYKFMDDQDRLSQTLPGGKASFFVGTLEPYAWHKIFNSKLSNQDRANLYIEGIEKLSKAKNLPELFRDIFKDAFLPFRDADTIAMFLNEINKFNYNHSEDLGNAFEYLLSIMGSQGDAGQFRTPRNIIEFIVDAVNPTKEDDILDPACGTAGFLVEAYKHITTGKKLSPNEIQELAKHIHGVDIDPGMAKIARVNLYLHGFKTPLVTEDDTLTKESLWSKKYDVILANPPFMTPKGGIKPHDKFSVQSKRAEVLFTDYIAEHLKLAGRAGIVVPEGIIFQSSNTYKQLRKMLVEDNYLWGVISLPTGVFNPYSGVKTSILLLDRKRASENKEILFYKVENDGFDLGAQRREGKKNDLPEALKIIEDWREGKKTESEKTLFIDKEKIAEDGDYNLSIDRYKTAVDYSNAKWPMVKLEDVCDVLNGFAFESRKYTEKGVRILRITNVQKGEIVDSNPKFYPQEKVIKKYLLQEEDLLVSLTGNVGRVGLVVPLLLPAVLNQRVACLRPKNKQLNKKYLFNVLNNDLFELDAINSASGIAQKNLSTEWLKKYKIPLPPLDIQEQVAGELNGYSSIISGAKQIVDNWKPKINIDPEWTQSKLGDICRIESTLIDPRENKYLDLIHIGAGNIESYSGELHDLKTSREEELISGKFLFDEETILYSKIRPYLVKVACPDFKGICSADIYPLLPDNKKIIKDFLYYILLSNEFTEYAIQGSGRVGMPKVNRNHLFAYNVATPSLKVQKEIIQKVEGERKLVESSKKLIEIYEQKIKEVVNNLWSE